MDWATYWTWIWQACLALTILAIPTTFFVGAVGSAVATSIKKVALAKQDNQAVLEAATFTSRPFSSSPQR